MSDVLAGAVAGLRMLADGTIAVSLHFEPKDRAAVMAMMGSPAAMIACARLKDGTGAAGQTPAPAPTFRDFGPICREAIELCRNPKFQEYISRPGIGAKWKSTEEAAKGYILAQCGVDSRKDLDTAEGARELFIEHVRKPFHRWLEERPERPGPASQVGY